MRNLSEHKAEKKYDEIKYFKKEVNLLYECWEV